MEMSESKRIEQEIQERREREEVQARRRRDIGKIGNFRSIVLIAVGLAAIFVCFYALGFLGIVDLPFPFLRDSQKESATQQSGDTEEEWLLELPVSQEQIEMAIVPLGFSSQEVDPVEGRKNHLITKGSSYVQSFEKDGVLELTVMDVQITDNERVTTNTKNAVKLYAQSVHSITEDWVIEQFDQAVVSQGESFHVENSLGGILTVVNYWITRDYRAFSVAYMLADDVYEGKSPFKLRQQIRRPDVDF